MIAGKKTTPQFMYTGVKPLCVLSWVGHRTLGQIWLSSWRPPTLNSHACSSLPSTPLDSGHRCLLQILCRERSHSQLLCPSVYFQFITSDSPGGPRDHQHQAQMDGPPKNWIKLRFMAEDFVLLQVNRAASHFQNEPGKYLFPTSFHPFRYWPPVHWLRDHGRWRPKTLSPATRPNGHYTCRWQVNPCIVDWRIFLRKQPVLGSCVDNHL